MTDVDHDQDVAPGDPTSPGDGDAPGVVELERETPEEPFDPIVLADIEHDDSLVEHPAAERRPLLELLGSGLDRWAAMPAEGWVSLIVVSACTLFVILAVHPDLVFRNNLPTGGDMGAHVIGPQYLVDHLLPHLRLSGWTPDWFAGYPLYGFYMVIPALAMAVLFTGLHNPALLALAVVVSLAVTVSGWVVPQLWRWRRALAVVGVVALLWAIPMPYGVGFKLVTVSGLITLPLAAWTFARLADLRFPAPPLFALAALFYINNREPVYTGIGNLIGGNMASTMAGEYSFSIALSLSLVYLGLLARGFKTGRHRASAAVLLALVGLCHLLPFFFTLLATFVMLVLQFRRKRLRWLLPVLVVAGLLASFWMLPFVWNRALTNDMGWQKLPYAGTTWATYLLPQHLLWIVALAAMGVFVTALYRNRTGLFLIGAVIATGVAFAAIPQAQLWNARILPFYYLSLFLLGAFGASGGLRALAGIAARIDGDHPLGMRTLFLASGLIALGAYVGFFISRPWRKGIAAPHVGGYVLLFAVAVAGMAFAFTEGANKGRLGRGRVLPAAMTPLVTLVGIGVLMFPLHVLPGEKTVTKNGTAVTDKSGSIQHEWLFGSFKSTDVNNMVAWARWNYTGYQGKVGTYDTSTKQYVHGWDEYHALMQTMGKIGQQQGCGRALWEQDNDLEGSYGTPMALMLLPYWTKSCITSEEGLYFESSSTTPYHWLLAAEASAKPSDPQRDLPYGSLDLTKAVQHMQLMGIKYYLAESAGAVGAAQQQPELTEIATSGPWHVYQVADTSPIVGLDHLPAVWDRAANQKSWLDPTISWFNDPSKWAVPYAASGPSNWPRVKTNSANWSKAWTSVGTAVQTSFAGGAPDPLPSTPKIPVRKANVSNMHIGTDTISFDVDKPGTPVLIRASYFPNWEASGANGPYRVTPNFMVVVPTAKHVSLHYGRTPMDWVATLMTIAGIALVVVLAGLAPVVVGSRRTRPSHIQSDELRPVPPAPAGPLQLGYADDAWVASPAPPIAPHLRPPGEPPPDGDEIDGLFEPPPPPRADPDA